MDSIDSDKESPQFDKIPKKRQKSNKRLGELLLDEDVVTKKQLKQALISQKNSKKKIGIILVEAGFATEKDIAVVLTIQYGLQYIDLTSADIRPDAIESLPLSIVEKYFVFPIDLNDKSIAIAMCDPSNIEAINVIESKTGKKVTPLITTQTEIKKAILQYYHNFKMGRLGEILIKAKLLDEKKLSICLEEQKKSKKKLGKIIVEKRILTEKQIATAISKQLNLPMVDLAKIKVGVNAIRLIPQNIAAQYNIFPIRTSSQSITIAMDNPTDMETINLVRKTTSMNVETVVSTPTDIKTAIKKHYISELFQKDESVDNRLKILSEKSEIVDSLQTLRLQSEDAPIVNLANKLLISAINDGASDIHIEPIPNAVRVRERIDGVLCDFTTLPNKVKTPLISRIKVMSNLDISERKRPQNGIIKINLDNRDIDIRVFTLPTHFGEKIVLRILDPTISRLDLESIGLVENDYKTLINCIETPQGMILVTGGAGSGKTTTLYSIIDYLTLNPYNIVSIEDPIEYAIRNVSQVQVKRKIEVDFANTLKTILRQDPDIIMVGEMRDQETANTAMQASISGHMVLSTLHTNTAITTITRLKNLGIPSYLIAGSLKCIVSQTLVRRLCVECKEEYTPSLEESKKIGLKNLKISDKKFNFYRAKGCAVCFNTGYKGRIGLFEVLGIDPTLRELIAEDAPIDVLSRAANDLGKTSLMEDGLRKAASGLTSFEELNRIAKVITEESITICSSCGEIINFNYYVCPYCGEPLKNRCPNCHKIRHHDWNVCPYCTTRLK